MQSFARSCRFVSGSDLAASTVPSGMNVASGASFPGLSSPPQRTQTLGTVSLYSTGPFLKPMQKLKSVTEMFVL